MRYKESDEVRKRNERMDTFLSAKTFLFDRKDDLQKMLDTARVNINVDFLHRMINNFEGDFRQSTCFSWGDAETKSWYTRLMMGILNEAIEDYLKHREEFEYDKEGQGVV